MVYAADLLHERRVRRQECLSAAEDNPRKTRQRSCYSRQLFLLSRNCSALLWGDCGTACRGRSDERKQRSALATRNRGKAVWTRSRFRKVPEPTTTESRRRKTDLPDRSLPRQRDGPKYFSLPLCQRNFRADLESP